MMLPNMDALIVRAAVPESELSRVKNGNKVVIRPIAYPELALEGSINRVSSIAQTIPGRPTWQRYFLVDIQLHDSNGKVKPGMSATVHVLTYHKQDALVISRSAVFWEGGEAFCRVAGEFSSKKRRLSLGMANDSHFEVVEGVKEGEKVATP